MKDTFNGKKGKEKSIQQNRHAWITKESFQNTLNPIPGKKGVDRVGKNIDFGAHEKTTTN